MVKPKIKSVVPRSAYQVDELSKGEKEMSEIVILTSLVLIIGLLGFISVMIYAIGEKLAEKDK